MIIAMYMVREIDEPPSDAIEVSATGPQEAAEGWAGVVDTDQDYSIATSDSAGTVVVVTRGASQWRYRVSGAWETTYYADEVTP